MKHFFNSWLWLVNSIELLVVSCWFMASCTGGSQQPETETDSVVIEETETEVEAASTVVNEFNGIVIDEMMSTVTIATSDSDTITYVKGENYQSDAAIGDEVIVTLDNENDEQEILNVKKI